MNGYTSHTYKWYNDKGEHHWIKLHFKTEQGIKNMTAAEADEMKSRDPTTPPAIFMNRSRRGSSPLGRSRCR